MITLTEKNTENDFLQIDGVIYHFVYQWLYLFV